MTKGAEKVIIGAEKKLKELKMTTRQAVRYILTSDRGISKAELGRLLGVTYSTIRNWEAGKTKMTYSVYLVFMEHFPDIEILDTFASMKYELGGGVSQKQVLPTKQAISYVLSKDPEATKVRLGRALSCTARSISNYMTGKTTLNHRAYVAFKRLYPTIEVTDVRGEV